MGKYANFYDGVRKLLDKIADALDPGTADTKTANYQTAVLNSLSRIGDKVGSAVLPDASTATDGDTLVVDDGEWTIGSGGGGGTGGGVLIVHEDLDTGYLDKTWQEIFDTLASETPVYIAVSDINNASMLAIVKASSIGGYKLYLQAMSDPFAEAESADDYPLDLDF